MKTQLTLAALALSLMTTSVFAAPSNAPFPLVGEAKDSQVQQQPVAPLAENGSERTPGAQRIHLAEDGSDRTPGSQRIQLAEDGAERTPGAQRIQLAEDGAERTPGSQRMQLAEGGSDRLIEQRGHTA
jgi:TRAP-type C4-dicarboxylate transport system substrate-binding protein